MNDRFDISHTSTDLVYFFPAWCQTTPNDQLFLLGAMRLARKIGNYSYLEIGSFRGGSLTPFLLDPACGTILSIDDRGRVHPDERGIQLDYAAITTQTMLDDLHGFGLSTDKLRTFDGSIDELAEDSAGVFNLAFIDGEHTDEACFRDFIWTFPLMAKTSIVAFHDSNLIYKSLRLIMLFLEKEKVEYTFVKRAASSMSALLFGDYRNIERAQFLGPEEDPSTFFFDAECARIKQQFRNRMRIRFVPKKILNLRVPLALDIEKPKKTMSWDGRGDKWRR